MLFIAIVALIATPTYYRRAKKNGKHPGKAARIPFTVAGCYFVFLYLSAKGIDGLAALLDLTEIGRRGMHLSLNLFAILTYIVLINRTLETLQSTKSGETGLLP